MISYAIKVTLCWAISYLAYTALLRPTTFFRLNRIYLVSTFVLSLFIPFLPWPELWQGATSDLKSPAVYMLPMVSTAPEDISVLIQATAPKTPAWQFALFAAYFLGATVFLLRLSAGLVQLWRWRREGRRENLGEFWLVHTDQATQPFSFFRWLYWPDRLHLDAEESRQMLEHEVAHIRQWHSLDLFIAELISALFWFTPLPWLYGRALRNVHEYLADAAVLQHSNRKIYGHLLVRQALLGSNISLVHNFSPAQLKKRIHMMTKHQTRPEALMRYVLMLPLPLLLGALFANRPANETALPENPAPVVMATDTIPTTAEVMPMYVSENCQGITDAKARQECAFKAMIQFIGKNLRYPEAARKAGIEGMAVVSFVVDETGAITNAKVVKDVGGGCGTEAMRVVESMPRWSPGMNDGKPVKVSMMLPVQFRLGNQGAQNKAEPAKTAPKAEEAPEEIFTVVEEMPRFPGCEDNPDKDARQQCAMQKMMSFIAQNLKYPEQARKDNIQGMAVIEFVVDKTGAIRDAKIVKQVEGGCGEEALRVVQSMPAWVPGIQKGIAVNAAMRLPVMFRLDQKPAPNASSPAPAPAQESTPKPAITVVGYPLPSANSPKATEKQAPAPVSEKTVIGYPMPSANPEKPLPLSELKGFRLSPNPNNGVFEVRFQPDTDNFSVKVYNRWGQEMAAYQLNSFRGEYQQSFDLSKQPKGDYLIVVKQGEKVYSGSVLVIIK